MSRSRIAGLAVAGLLVVLFGGRWLALQYTEALWFADLGRSAQFGRLLANRLAWQALIFALATAWFGAQAYGVYASIGAVHLPRRIGNLVIAEAVPRGVLRAIVAGTGLLFGLATAATFHDVGDYVALYRAAVPLGVPEPVLGRDASFYLAQLPLIEALHLVALIAAVMGLLLTGTLYALTGSLAAGKGRVAITPHARSHLVGLLAVLALVLAWGFRIDAFQLVGGGGSHGGALSSVDRSLRLPLSSVLAAASLLVAALTVLWLRWGRGVTLGGLWLGFALVAATGRYVVPFLAETWGAPPEPTVALALADLGDRYARAGAGVLAVRPETEPSRSEPDADSLASLPGALAGLSPWLAEPELLTVWLAAAAADSARALLWTTTPSAYPEDGRLRLTAVAVPETDVLALLRSSPRPDWTAFHRGPLAWGGEPLSVRLDASPVAATPASADSTGSVAEDAGPVRFVAHPAELAVVGADASRPGEPDVGIPLRGVVRRLLLAWALQSPPLLGNRTSETDRVLYWRDVPTRLRHLYPFADFEEPRAIVDGGRLVWLSVGVLASDRFPLAEAVDWPGQRVNFLRAAYVATVDAHSGATALYLRGGPDTAFAAALSRGVGATVEPFDRLPPGLRAHVGYPAELLDAQAEVLAKHHGEPGDAPWALARRSAPVSQGAVPVRRPISLLALLTLGGRQALWRVVPVTDAGGNRLVGFVAGQASGAAEPAPRLLRLPSAEFATVAAAESRLNASPAVVGAMAAAGGTDGAVHRSPVFALPVAGTVVYVQVLFASPRRLSEPLRVRAVALMAGGRIGVGSDVADAARALASARSAGFLEGPDEGSLAAARTAFRTLDAAARRGDWAAFGRAMEELRRTLGVLPEVRP